MALRHPVVITPLEEDLKRIGLLREQDDEEPAPEPDPEGGYAEMGDETPEDEPDKPMGEQADDEEPAPEPDPEGGYATEEEGEDDEDDEDAAVEAIGTLAGHFLAQHQAIGPKPAGAVAEGKPAQRGRPLHESKAQRVQRLATGNLFGGSPKRAPEPTNRVTALLEEVSDIVGDIHRSRKEEQIKGFANIAVIADTLASRFSDWGMALSEGNLYRVGAMMKKLSEQSADMAVKLDTPPGEEDPEMEMDEPPMDDEPEDAAAMEQEGGDDAKVDELFKKFMAKLLDALQLYNDVTGKSESDEELPGDDKEDSVDDADMDDDDDAAENDPEIDDADMGEMDDEPALDDEPDDPDMESGEIPPGIKTSETDPEGDDDEDEEPMGEQEGDDEEGDDEGGDEKDPPYGVGAEESAISEARKRLTAMKKKLTAKKKGKGKKVLKGGKGKLQDGLPFVHTTKGKPGAKKKRK